MGYFVDPRFIDGVTLIRPIDKSGVYEMNYSGT